MSNRQPPDDPTYDWSNEQGYNSEYADYQGEYPPEQDQQGTGDLPTYDDLAAQSGPNSRFGRWRGWIEKRAAERYADTSPEEHARRRARGWDLDSPPVPPASAPVHQSDPATATAAQAQARPASRLSRFLPKLRVNADLPALPAGANSPPDADAMNAGVARPAPSASEPDLRASDDEPAPPPGEPLAPAHVSFHQFGSRFLPHCTAPIRCVLPLRYGRWLLVGHDAGLSVMDLFPQEWVETGGLAQKGPADARVFPVWTGEAVLQMSLLEQGYGGGEGTAQGVVLALVGPDADKSSGSHAEPVRTLRMYNLSSLLSLVKWTISQQGLRPLDLSRPTEWNAQHTSGKKHRPASSITKGLRNLISESPTTRTSPPQSFPRPGSSSSSSLLSLPADSYQQQNHRHNHHGHQGHHDGPRHKSSSTSLTPDSPWDVVDELPLRWATDFVPLAGASSRLASLPVICYALSKDAARPTERALLAVATKSNIFLYETPKNERAFHFVKEFYTPTCPRALAFVEQSVQDIFRTMSDGRVRVPGQPVASSGAHARGVSSSGDGVPAFSLTSVAAASRASTIIAPANVVYGAQPAIFVVFDKRAGIIRLADAAVTEVEISDAVHLAASGSAGSRDTLSVGSYGSFSAAGLGGGGSGHGGSASRRSRVSMDFSYVKEGRQWAVPVQIDVPVAGVGSGATRGVYFLTRGRQTYVFPAPLPASIPSTPPLHAVTWRWIPTSVSARIVAVSLPSTPPVDAEYASAVNGEKAEAQAGARARDEREPCVQLVAMSEDGLEVQEFPVRVLIPGAGGGPGKGKGKARDTYQPQQQREPVRAQMQLGEMGFLRAGGFWHRPLAMHVALGGTLDNYRPGVPGAPGAAGSANSTNDNAAGGLLGRTNSTASDATLGSLESLRSLDSEEIAARLAADQGMYGWWRKDAADWRVFWMGGDGREGFYDGP